MPVAHEEYFVLSFVVPLLVLFSCGMEQIEWLGNNVAHVTKAERYKKVSVFIFRSNNEYKI
jgi:hypothetical protein